MGKHDLFQPTKPAMQAAVWHEMRALMRNRQPQGRHHRPERARDYPIGMVLFSLASKRFERVCSSNAMYGVHSRGLDEPLT